MGYRTAIFMGTCPCDTHLLANIKYMKHITADKGREVYITIDHRCVCYKTNYSNIMLWM